MTTTSLPVSDQVELPASPWPDFVGHWPRLRGRQEPEFESRHPGDESEGDRCAKFGARVGLRCMPWEWQTLRGILSLQPPDQYGDRVWTHRDVCIECTRQQGKTLIIVLLILFHLFVLRTKRIIYTAQRWSTAADVFDRVVAVIRRVPSLQRRLAKPPSKRDNHGVIELRNGAKAEFGPRSQDFARGVTELDLLIVDESYDVDAAQDAALTGAQSAAKNPQTIYLSTPPVFAEHPKCHVLAGLHRLGFARAADLFYQLFAAPAGMARTDPAWWTLALPSFGVSMNEREIRSKLQKAKTSAQKALFDADYMGRGDYPPPEVDDGSEIPAQKWAEMAWQRSARAALTGSPAIAVHRQGSGPWVITAGWYLDTGRVHLEIGYSRIATSVAVVAAVAQLVADWDPVVVAIKARGDAAAIEADLIKVGIEPEMINSSVYSQWCGGFLNAALAGTLSHSDQTELNDAAASAVRREMPNGGGFVWDDAAAGSSAAALTSATLVHGALLKFAARAKPMPLAPVVAATRDASASQGHFSAEIDVMTVPF